MALELLAMYHDNNTCLIKDPKKCTMMKSGSKIAGKR